MEKLNSVALVESSASEPSSDASDADCAAHCHSFIEKSHSPQAKQERTAIHMFGKSCSVPLVDIYMSDSETENDSDSDEENTAALFLSRPKLRGSTSFRAELTMLTWNSRRHPTSAPAPLIDMQISDSEDELEPQSQPQQRPKTARRRPADAPPPLIDMYMSDSDDEAGFLHSSNRRTATGIDIKRIADNTVSGNNPCNEIAVSDEVESGSLQRASRLSATAIAIKRIADSNVSGNTTWNEIAAKDPRPVRCASDRSLRSERYHPAVRSKLNSLIGGKDHRRHRGEKSPVSLEEELALFHTNADAWQESTSHHDATTFCSDNSISSRMSLSSNHSVGIRRGTRSSRRLVRRHVDEVEEFLAKVGVPIDQDESLLKERRDTHLSTRLRW